MDQPVSSRNGSGSLMTGIIVIIIGVVFLLRNFDIIELGHRWWALFLLIPMAFLGSDVWKQVRAHNGKWPSSARGSMIGLIAVTTVMSVFLFGFNWALVWPVFIIIGGLAVLFGK